MSLSEKYKKSREQIISRRNEIASERAKIATDEFMHSEAFKLALESGLSAVKNSVEGMVKQAVDMALDPINELKDSLLAHNIPNAVLRKYIHKLYSLYLHNQGEPEPAYEQMEYDVALYVGEHSDIWESIRVFEGTETIAEILAEIENLKPFVKNND